MVLTGAELAVALGQRIAWHQQQNDLWSSNQRPELATLSRSHVAGGHFDIGVCRLLLGDVGAARTALDQAADGAAAAFEQATPRTHLLHEVALELTVLAGDADLARALAGETVDLEARPSLVLDRQAWALALPALVRGDDALAVEHASAAASAPPTKAWFPGLGQAIAAVASGDEIALHASLEQILAKHLRYARAKRSHLFNTTAALVCIPAAVLVRLAAVREMDIGDLRKARAAVPLIVHAGDHERLEVQVEADRLLAELPSGDQGRPR